MVCWVLKSFAEVPGPNGGLQLDTEFQGLKADEFSQQFSLLILLAAALVRGLLMSGFCDESLPSFLADALL